VIELLMLVAALALLVIVWDFVSGVLFAFADRRRAKRPAPPDSDWFFAALSNSSEREN
jgi:hypothetical protein